MHRARISPPFRLLFLAGLVALVGFPLPQAMAQTLVPFEARAELYRNGKLMGETRFTFESDGERWTLTSDTKGTKGLAKFLGISENFVSKGRWVDGQARPDGFDQGWYYTPTILDCPHQDIRTVREEMFGPILSALSFETEEEVIARANATEFGLSAGVFTQDLKRGHRVIDQLEAGSCWINTYNLAPVEAPFGGVKMSGVGRENSKEAINHYSEVKTVYVAMTPVEAQF